jgi:signal transduction histidine kinase
MRHELRTPLNAILGFSDLLHSRAAGDLTPKQERYVKNIQQGGRRLLSLVDDILEYAVVQSRDALDRESVAVKPLLDELAATYQAAAELRGITLSVQADLLSTITGDRLRLGRALRQLLDNAVKFTGDGGHVMVTAMQAGNAIVITVRDTGVGIALDDQQRIFEPFVQVDGSDSRPHDGSGLGLAIAHRIVALHGGTITVQSARERGSTFTVRLPVSGQATARARRKNRSEMRAA